jgi:flagellar hook assembly protein FlgD
MQTTSHLPSLAQEAPKNPVSPPETAMTSPGSQAHSGLEVTVRQPAAGLVTVRVLKEDGTEAAFLYQGSLPAGQWVFGWDGKLADGSPAQPGSYQIQVTSGSVTRSKIVFIRKQGSE